MNPKELNLFVQFFHLCETLVMRLSSYTSPKLLGSNGPHLLEFKGD